MILLRRRTDHTLRSDQAGKQLSLLHEARWVGQPTWFHFEADSLLRLTDVETLFVQYIQLT